jgi:NTP pyrophosphatase (non-canonical NTP hydrolase)
MALTVESAELLECYQWLTPEQAMQPSPPQREAIADEMADVLWVLTALANQCGVDLEQAIQDNFDKVNALGEIAKRYT